MNKIILIAAIFILLTNFALSQGRGFGIGIVLGEPTGVSAKLWTSSSNAFDFAAAWSFKDDGHLLLQADYVWHSFDLISVSSGRLPLYYGIGGRVIFADDPLIGVRIPVGLNYQFATAPIDIFAEIVPILDLIPSTDFDLGGGLGVRFWFN
jgi:hypothetical protein